MPPDFDLSSFLYLGGVAVIVGAVQVLKPFVSDTRLYLPIAIACGLVLNLVIGYAVGVAWAQSLIMGFIAGLAAGGAYSYGATLKEGKLADKKNRPSSTRPPDGVGGKSVRR